MNRSLSILFTLIMVAVCGVLVPAPVRAQQAGPGITVKSDGDDIVLTPQEPGKSFLVLGFSSEKGQESAKGFPGHLSFLTGEAPLRFPAKQYERILVWELGASGEVDRNRHVLLPSPRAKPPEPGCPPRCPYLQVYLVWMNNPSVEHKEKP
jgi:hypothetical protein